MPERDRDFGVLSTPQFLYHGLVLDLENIWRFRDKTHYLLPKQFTFQHGGTENSCMENHQVSDLSCCKLISAPGIF